MSRFLRCITMSVFGALLIYHAIAYAATTTENGVTVKTFQTNDANYAKLEIMFQNDPTDTRIYNDDDGTDTSAGAVNVSKYNDSIAVQIKIATLGSTGMDIRIEGRAGTDTQWGEIATKSFSAVTTIDYIVNVAEKPQYIRVAGSATGTIGTDSVTLTALCKEKRSGL